MLICDSSSKQTHAKVNSEGGVSEGRMGEPSLFSNASSPPKDLVDGGLARGENRESARLLHRLGIVHVLVHTGGLSPFDRGRSRRVEDEKRRNAKIFHD